MIAQATGFVSVPVHAPTSGTIAAIEERVPAVLDKYGARFLARGGRHETLEGDAAKTRVVVIEFESFEPDSNGGDDVSRDQTSLSRRPRRQFVEAGRTQAGISRTQSRHDQH